MKAFVLAGGLGTRLKPRFGDLPKPLAPIAGKPFLARQVEWLAGPRIRRAVIRAGRGATQLQSALGDAAAGVALEWSIEAEPLGTGGALRLATPVAVGPSPLVNGGRAAGRREWAA